MQDKFFTAFNEQTRTLFEPARKLNGLLLDNLEKVTQYQLESLKRYSQLGTERLRDASEIKDAEDLRDFGTRQAEVLNELSRQMLEDARAVAELSVQFKGELDVLFTDTAQQAAAQAEEAVKSATAQAEEAVKSATAQTEGATKSTAAPAKATSQTSKKSS